MHYSKAIIQYNGLQYCGFQYLPELKTVQNEINLALSQLNLGKVTTNCASRTDSGVHAIHQILKISSENILDSSRIEEINTKLSNDIRFISIEECTWDFHPSKCSTEKTYRYLFTNMKLNSKEKYPIANIANDLDWNLINLAIDLIPGEHDFINFCSKGSNVKSTLRTIYKIKLSKINPHQEFQNQLFTYPEYITECYQIEINGNGFLKQMVRHLISALWSVGTKKITLDEFQSLLNSSIKAKQLWKVAPPDGLYLYDIKLK